MTQETPTFQDLQERVESQRLLAEYNELVAHNQWLEHQNRVVTESFNQPIDYRERWYDEPDFYPVGSSINAPYFQTEVDDRDDGAFRPIFEDEHDLDILRAQANRVVWFDEIGIGALSALKNYVFQDGLKFVPTPKKNKTVPQSLLDETSELIDHILSVNGYYGDEENQGLDHQFHDRARIDGEVLLELRWENGDVVWHEHEPMHLTEPDQQSREAIEDWLADRVFGVQNWKFGVHRLKGSHKDLGYHLVFNQEGTDWDYVPAERFVHYKRNVYRTTKRGFSDFMQITRNLERRGKLDEALALGAAIQASIAFAVEYPEGAKHSSIQSTVLGTADYTKQRQKESGATTIAVNQFRPGMIPHFKKGQKYVSGPLGAERGSHFVEIGAYILRLTSVRFTMPEFMISGDASNGNYSSTGITHDAFVKAREEDQRDFGTHNVRNIWKSLRMYHVRGKYASGYDWEDLKRTLRIVPDGRDPSTKSPLEKRQALQIEVDYGWTSSETASTECGRHYDEEIAKGAERAPSPNMQAEQKMTEALREAWRHGGY